MEIITLEEFKKHERIEHDLEDEVIERIITASEQAAMNWCRTEFDEDCDEPVKQAIIMHAGYTYAHRSEPEKSGYDAMMQAFRALLSPYADLSKAF